MSHLSDKPVLVSIGGYRIGKKIDAGTFATVRFAERKLADGTIHPLAVKIIDKAKASPLYVNKFLRRELAIWPKLHHHHIIKVEDIRFIEKRVYIFMELAPYGSVIDYLQKHGAVDESMGQLWCKHMCEALRYCHNKGITHRDLKCDNMLIDKDLQIKVGDFGFSCCSFDRHRGTPIFSDTYCGSPSYVAPEVMAGKPYNPFVSDVWSAGVCMYVILNNAMPFDDSNLMQMFEDQAHQRWQFTPDADRKISKSAKRLMKKMLQPDVNRRPTIDQVLNTSWMKRPVVSVHCP